MAGTHTLDNTNLVSHTHYTHMTLQEVDVVREQVQRLVSLPLWANLLPVSHTSNLRDIWHHLTFSFSFPIRGVYKPNFVLCPSCRNIGLLFNAETSKQMRQPNRGVCVCGGGCWRRRWRRPSWYDLLCRAQRERSFLSRMMEQFLQVLDTIPAEGRP